MLRIDHTRYSETVHGGSYYIVDTPGIDRKIALREAAAIQTIIGNSRSVTLLVAFSESDLTNDRGANFYALMTEIMRLVTLTGLHDL